MEARPLQLIHSVKAARRNFPGGSHMNANRSVGGLATLFTLGVILLFPNSAMAHCDGMDGPVVKAAQKALASGDVNHVLIWVQTADEQEVRQAFEGTLVW